MKTCDVLVNADIYFKGVSINGDKLKARNEILTLLSSITKEYSDVDFDIQSIDIREKEETSE